MSVCSPLGTAVPLAGSPVDSGDGQTFTIAFSNPQSLAGTYPVTIGPEVLDVAGNVMNQNHDYQNGDGYSRSFAIAATAVVPDYVQDFETGDFGTLSGWSFSVDSGAGFYDRPVGSDGRFSPPEVDVGFGVLGQVRAGQFIGGSVGMGSGESADIGLPGLEEHE